MEFLEMLNSYKCSNFAGFLLILDSTSNLVVSLAQASAKYWWTHVTRASCM